MTAIQLLACAGMIVGVFLLLEMKIGRASCRERVCVPV